MWHLKKNLDFYFAMGAGLFFLLLFAVSFTFGLQPLPAEVTLLRIGAGIWTGLFFIACVVPRAARINLLLVLVTLYGSLWLMNGYYDSAISWVAELSGTVVAPAPAPPVADEPQYEAVMQERAAGYNAYPYVYHSDTYYDASYYSDASVAVCDHNAPTYDAKKCGEVTPFPMGGISNARMVLCIPRGYTDYIKGWAMYDTDRYGFNNPDSVYSYDRPVLVSGDSFVQGVCVNKGDDVTARLRARGWPAISLGEGGNGPFLEYARLKEYGPTVKPSLVLWLFTEGNDLDDTLREGKDKILRAYFEHDGFTIDLVHRQDAIDAYLKRLEANASETRYIYEQRQCSWHSHRGWAVKLASFPKLVEPFETWASRWQTQLAAQFRLWSGADSADAAPSPSQASVFGSGDITPAELKTTVDTFGDILIKARKLTESWGGRLVFVMLQDYTTTVNYQPEDGQPWPTRRRWIMKDAHQAVLAKVKSLGIQIVDFGEVIGADKDPLRYYEGRGWGHYTVFGYDRLAQFITERVAR